MELHLVGHKHAISSWLTVCLTSDSMKTVLVVQTDLVLNVEDPKFDGAVVGNLFAAVQEYLRLNKHIDSADIQPTLD